MGEFLPNYEASLWFGVGAPKTTPAEVIETLNKGDQRDPCCSQFQGAIDDLGASVFPGSSADFVAHIARETIKWEEVVKFSGARVK